MARTRTYRRHNCLKWDPHEVPDCNAGAEIIQSRFKNRTGEDTRTAVVHLYAFLAILVIVEDSKCEQERG